MSSPYSNYRDSRISWLGSVPSHWTDTKLKHLAPFQVGWTPPTKNDANFEGHNLWANISDLKQKRIFDTAKRISDDAASAASMEITPKGSLLYSFKLSVGAVAFSGVDMYTNEAIASFLENTRLPLEYLYYAFPIFVIQNAATNIYGARILNQELIKNADLLAPPFEEAAQIANFLDHETAKIDALIEKQQQLIALLKEKRQAVISHAVTKGLNPDAPMRDSGVEWLGEVPAHWTVCKIKQVAELESGHTPSKKVDEYWENCDIPWVSLNDTRQLKVVDYISDTAVLINEKGMTNSSAHELPAGCVVFTRDASIGLAAITSRAMAVSQHLIAWVCNPMKVSSEYLLLVFYAMEAELERFTFGATLKTIGMPDVKRLTGAFPPLDEQAHIVKQVFAARATFSASIRKSEEMLEILAERRTALISAAVTGKIDIRDWKAPETEAEVA